MDVVASPSAEEFMASQDAKWKRDLLRRKLNCFKDIGRQGFHCWMREAWTFLPQYNLPTKVFSVERLRFVEWRGVALDAHLEGDRDSPIEYRFGYWVVARNGLANGKWWWAQFSPIIPGRDLTLLLDKARTDRTILPA